MSKPEFDPNKPFKSEENSKPEFDSSKPFEPENSSVIQGAGLGQKIGSNILSFLNNPIDQSLDFAGGASTLGSEEIGKREGGLIQASLSGGQHLLHKAGLAEESPYYVDEALKEQGLKGDLQPSAYESGKQIQTNKYAELKAKSPWLFEAGKLGGGLAGFGAAGEIASAGGELASGIPEIGNALERIKGFKGAVTAAQEAGDIGKGTAIAGRALGSAVEAAPTGAVFSAAASNKDIGSADYLKDVAKGAATGSAIAGAVSVLPEIGKAIGESSFGRRAKEAFGQGLKGNLPFTQSGQAAMRSGATKEVESLTQDLQKGSDALGVKKQKVLSDAGDNPITPSNETIDSLGSLETELKNNTNLNSTFDIQNSIKEGLAKLRNNELNAEDADVLRGDLKSILKFDPQLKEIVNPAQKSLANDIDSVASGYKDANEDFTNFKNLYERLQTGGLNTPAFGKATAKNTMVKGQKVAQGLAKDTGKSIDTIENIKNTLADITKNNPDVFKNAGVDPNALISKLTKASDIYNVAETLKTPIPKGLDVTKPGTYIGGTAQAASQLAGQTVPYVAGLALKPLKTMSDFVKLGVPELNQVAQKLRSSAAYKHLGDALINAGTPQKRNAVIFTMMQNPGVRQTLGLEAGTEEQGNK